MKKAFIGTLMVLLAMTTSLASADLWLHVRVVEDGSRGEKVSINIPLELIEAILPSIETDQFHHGRLHWQPDEFEGIDLRAMLEALRDAPDAEYVTVESDDENVRVAKENGMLVIRAEERDGERVRVTIPLAIVDAMLGDDPHEIDLIAGLRALAAYSEGDLVTVESDDTHVRIWIDSQSSGE